MLRSLTIATLELPLVAVFLFMALLRKLRTDIRKPIATSKRNSTLEEIEAENAALIARIAALNAKRLVLNRRLRIISSVSFLLYFSSSVFNLSTVLRYSRQTVHTRTLRNL